MKKQLSAQEFNQKVEFLLGGIPLSNDDQKQWAQEIIDSHEALLYDQTTHYGLWATDRPDFVHDPTGIMFRIGFPVEHKPPFILNHRSGSNLRRVSFKYHKDGGYKSGEGFFIMYGQSFLEFNEGPVGNFTTAIVEDDHGRVFEVSPDSLIFVDKQGSSAGPSLSATACILHGKSKEDEAFDKMVKDTVHDVESPVTEELAKKAMKSLQENTWFTSEKLRPDSDRWVKIKLSDNPVSAFYSSEEDVYTTRGGIRYQASVQIWRDYTREESDDDQKEYEESISPWMAGSSFPDTPRDIIIMMAGPGDGNELYGYYSPTLKEYIVHGSGTSYGPGMIKWREKTAQDPQQNDDGKIYSWSAGTIPPNSRRDVIFQVGVAEYVGCYAPMTKQYLRRDEKGLLLAKGFTPAEVNWREIVPADYKGNTGAKSDPDWKPGIHPPADDMDIEFRPKDWGTSILIGRYKKDLHLYVAPGVPDTFFPINVTWRYAPVADSTPLDDLPF